MYLTFLSCSFAAVSCSSLSDSEVYLESFQSKNIVLNAKQETEDWLVGLSYYTPEFMALNENKNNQSLEFDKILQEYSGVEYYKLKLQHRQRDNKLSKDLLDSFPFKFNDRISLVTKQDTLKSELYHYESDLSGQNIYTFLLAFQPILKQDRNIFIKDFEGKDINLKIAQSEINKIPKLKL